MCELMEKFGERKLEEGRMEGRLEGRAEGRLEGHAEGREVGRIEGHREGMLDMVRSLFMLNVPIEVIEQSSGLTRTEILALQDAAVE